MIRMACEIEPFGFDKQPSYQTIIFMFPCNDAEKYKMTQSEIM